MKDNFAVSQLAADLSISGLVNRVFIEMVDSGLIPG